MTSHQQDIKKLNSVILEDVTGEAHNTKNNDAPWTTNVFENRKKTPQNEISARQLQIMDQDEVSNHAFSEKAKIMELPMDKRIQAEYEQIKAKEKMLKLLRQQT